jgi:hypothetical protein
VENVAIVTNASIYRVPAKNGIVLLEDLQRTWQCDPDEDFLVQFQQKNV